MRLRRFVAISDLGLNAHLLGWNRAVLSDIQASIHCGLKRVHISIPVSDMQIQVKFQGKWARMLEQLRDAINFARDHGFRSQHRRRRQLPCR